MFLLEKGADPNIINNFQETALHIAIQNSYLVSLCDIFIDKTTLQNLEILTEDRSFMMNIPKKPKNILGYCIYLGYNKYVKYLIERGCNMYITSPYGNFFNNTVNINLIEVASYANKEETLLCLMNYFEKQQAFEFIYNHKKFVVNDNLIDVYFLNQVAIFNMTKVMARVKWHHLKYLLLATKRKKHFIGNLFTNGGIGDLKIFGIIAAFII